MGHVNMSDIQSCFVKCDTGRIGWEDNKGSAIRERISSAYDQYCSEFKVAEEASDAYHLHCKKMADLLEKKAPSVKDLARF